MRWLVLLLALGPVCGAWAHPDEKLEAEIASVGPSKSEARWLSIPWEQNLMRARARAARANKPLLIWIMDGHVLGNT